MNGNFFDLLRNEVQKTRRTLATLMLVLAPLSVVLLMLLLYSARTKTATEVGWENVVRGGIAVWAYMVFPLLVALQAAVINGIEHRVDGWKRMFALPIHPARFFLAKLASLIIMMAATSFLLVIALYVMTGLAHAITPTWPAIPDGGFVLLLRYIGACLGGGLCVLVIHHALSWTMPSFVFPIGLGIVAVMAVFQVGSSRFWVWHPWTWPMTAAASADPTRGLAAVQLGVLFAVPLAFVVALFARRLRRLG